MNTEDLQKQILEINPDNEKNMARISKIKCFLFDMDGTVILGKYLIPGMEGFFDRLKAANRRFYLVTNNSSNDHHYYMQKMRMTGVTVDRNDVMISSDAMVYWLKKNCPEARLFVLGTNQLKEILKEAGFTLTTELEDRPDYVLIGFDKTLNYETLTIACRLIDKGVPYIATHPDVRCPIEDGEFIPDTGAFMACIETATGKKPTVITGKPFSTMVETVIERTGFCKDEIAMVGDRLSTDIRFGTDNGILSILVLTGEAALEDVEKENIHPDIILPHCKYILDHLD